VFKVLYPETNLMRRGLDAFGRRPEDRREIAARLRGLGVQPLGGDGITLGAGEKEECLQEGGLRKRLQGKSREGLMEEDPGLLEQFEVKEIPFIEATEGGGTGKAPVSQSDAAMEVFGLKILEEGGFPFITLLDKNTS